MFHHLCGSSILRLPTLLRAHYGAIFPAFSGGVAQVALACNQGTLPWSQHPVGMKPRTDYLTASRVDLTLMLLPLIGRWEAACTLAVNDVPLEVAARVLALPLERRPMLQPAFQT